MDFSVMIVFVAIGSIIAVPFLCHAIYKANMRWRCMVYCWQAMSDFAGHRLKEDGEHDWQWVACVKEQKKLMAHFKLAPFTVGQTNDFEEDLFVRLKLVPLEEHFS